MDRIDIHLDVRRVPFEKLASLEGGEPPKLIRGRVEAARKVQETRFVESGKEEQIFDQQVHTFGLVAHATNDIGEFAGLEGYLGFCPTPYRYGSIIEFTDPAGAAGDQACP